MDSFAANDSRDETPAGNDQALWQLLGHARAVEASPYFARKVLREIQAAPQPTWWKSWRFVWRTLAPTTVCAGVALLAVAGTVKKAPLVASNGSGDLEFETIQNLDLLVSNYESSLWLDSSSPSR